MASTWWYENHNPAERVPESQSVVSSPVEWQGIISTSRGGVADTNCLCPGAHDGARMCVELCKKQVESE